MPGMIFHHPFVSFDGFGVIFEKEIEPPQFDMGLNKKMTLGKMVDDLVHFLNGFSPSSLLHEKKGDTKLCFLRPLAVRIKTDQFSIGLHGLLFHPFLLVLIPQLHQRLTGKGVLWISFYKSFYLGNKRVVFLFLKETKEDSKISLRRFFLFGIGFDHLQIGMGGLGI